MSELDDIAKKMQDHMDRMMLDVFMGPQTSTVVREEKPVNAADLIKSMEQFLRNARREQITFVVDLAHQGPMLTYETPCDGKRVEMSWVQANELHQHWPLKLSNVLSQTSAEFIPISGVFHEFVPKILPMPPYEVSGETFEEWWGGKKPERA